jgi:hypothetical protein
MATPTPEELRAEAGRLFDSRLTRESTWDHLPRPGEEFIGEAPTSVGRGGVPTVLVLTRASRQGEAVYFLTVAKVGPGGRRIACTKALVVSAGTLPMLGELIATAMERECDGAAHDSRLRPAAPADSVEAGPAVTTQGNYR